MFPRSEGLYSPFPIIPRGRTEGFSFKREFRRTIGRDIIKAIKAMCGTSETLEIDDLVYALPLARNFFPHRNYFKNQEQSVREELERSIRDRLNAFFANENEASSNILLNGLDHELFLYTLSFGSYSLESSALTRILDALKNDISDKSEFNVPSSSRVASYLILGGDPSLVHNDSSEILGDINPDFIRRLRDFQETRKFDADFARYALEYKVLQEHLG